jgi:chaperonin cofactor prefoldin
MIDYASMIDKRIEELQAEIDQDLRNIQQAIEEAMAEFIYHEACKDTSLSETVNMEIESAEADARRYRKNVLGTQTRIEALKAYKERLEDPNVKSFLDGELERLSSLTYAEPGEEED